MNSISPIKCIFSIGYDLIRCFNELAIIFPISSVLNADQEYRVSTNGPVSTV